MVPNFILFCKCIKTLEIKENIFENLFEVSGLKIFVRTFHIYLNLKKILNMIISSSRLSYSTLSYFIYEQMRQTPNNDVLVSWNVFKKTECWTSPHNKNLGWITSKAYFHTFSLQSSASNSTNSQFCNLHLCFLTQSSLLQIAAFLHCNHLISCA